MYFNVCVDVLGHALELKKKISDIIGNISNRIVQIVVYEIVVLNILPWLLNLKHSQI